MGGLARLNHQETIFPHISLLYIPALTRNTHCHCTLNLNDLDSSRHLAHPGTLTKNDVNNSIWELAKLSSGPLVLMKSGSQFDFSWKVYLA